MRHLKCILVLTLKNIWPFEKLMHDVMFFKNEWWTKQIFLLRGFYFVQHTTHHGSYFCFPLLVSTIAKSASRLRSARSYSRTLISCCLCKFFSFLFTVVNFCVYMTFKTTLLSEHRVFHFHRHRQGTPHCASATKSSVVVCDAHLIYNLLLLKTSIKLHVSFCSETGGSNRGTVSWHQGVCCRSSGFSCPSRCKGSVCYQTPRCRLPDVCLFRRLPPSMSQLWIQAFFLSFFKIKHNKSNPRSHCKVYIRILFWKSCSYIFPLHIEWLDSPTCTRLFNI